MFQNVHRVEQPLRSGLGGEKILHLLRVVMLASTVLAGCATPRNALLTEEKPAPGKVAVFGTISLVDVQCDPGDYSSLTLVENTTSTEAGCYHFSGPGGSFCWSLPQGDYSLKDFSVDHVCWTALGREVKICSFRIYGKFKVGADLQPTYLGDLVVRMDSARATAEVVDRFDDAKHTLASAYPSVSGVPVKELIKK